MFKYIVYYGNEGFEALIDVTDVEEKHLANELLLADGKEPEVIKQFADFRAMQLRIMFNSHRDIQSYAFESESELTVDDLCKPEIEELIRTKYAPDEGDIKLYKRFRP